MASLLRKDYAIGYMLLMLLNRSALIATHLMHALLGTPPPPPPSASAAAAPVSARSEESHVSLWRPLRVHGSTMP